LGNTSSSEKAVFFFFLFLFFVSILLTGKLIAPFFDIIILGLVFTSIFIPIYKFFLKKFSVTLSSIITCSIIFFVIFVPVLFFIGILSKEAYDLYSMAKDAVLRNQLKQLLQNNHALEIINDFFANMGFQTSLSWDDFINHISDIGKFIGLSMFQQASFIASNVFKIISYFCLMLIVVFYLLIDGEKFASYIYNLSPLPDEHNKKILKKFKDMAGAVLIGNGLASLIQGICGGIVFFIFGLNSPFLWGVIMGFLAFLPIVGIGLVLIPSGFFLMLNQRILAGIFMILFYGILSLGIEYVFKPKIVGDRVKIHPLVIFFAIIGGLKLYGILGIIYGPLIITLFLTLVDIYFASFQAIVEPKH